jgi:hypothetical protein
MKKFLIQVQTLALVCFLLVREPRTSIHYSAVKVPGRMTLRFLGGNKTNPGAGKGQRMLSTSGPGDVQFFNCQRDSLDGESRTCQTSAGLLGRAIAAPVSAVTADWLR